MKWRKFLSVFIPVLAIGVILATGIVRNSMADWRTASRESAGIAPDPKIETEAIVQIYSARAYSWRGTFGVHTWIAVKPSHAPRFSVYEVIGWRVLHGSTSLAISERPADGRWFGNMPEIIADLRGEGVDDIIKRIDIAAKSYPYMGDYKVWPGPNSNTFTAYVARAIPELRLDLPPTAIGKDYIPGGKFVAPSPSGTGYQLSLFGLLGVMVSAEEGLEINLLGFTFGVDIGDLALKLPIAGRIGFSGS